MNFNPISLLLSRRFGAFFVAQFLGAFNDNLYRNALAALLVFGIGMAPVANVPVIVNVAAGLFILPFFLFSAPFGQLADRGDKAWLVRLSKLLEVLICMVAGLGLYLGELWLLLAVVFLLGLQSALFGPVKYAILPQLLDERALIDGNGLVAAGTYLAILFGTVAGPLVAGIDAAWPWPVFTACLLVAVVGWVAALGVPEVARGDPDLVVDWNPLTSTVRCLKVLWTSRMLLIAALAVSWFWFYGTVFLVQLPTWTQGVVGGDHSVLAATLALFVIGISAGALSCARWSRGRVRIGLVVAGAFGMSLSGLDLWWASPRIALDQAGIVEVARSAGSWRWVLDLLAIGFFAGLYIVPLYTLVQRLAGDRERAQAIAALNILNSLFMLLAGGLAVIVLGVLQWSIPALFALVAAMNLPVAACLVRWRRSGRDRPAVACAATEAAREGG
ncbi:MAG: hypothetical protein Kow0020_00610 [Wenzhouxiangellaceae bacterium]